jgi:predicted phage terminase large subunit-like protein
LTHNGWKTHGDLKAGDYVYNPNGNLVKVLAVSKKDIANMAIEFTNGEIIYCHENHEWTVFNRNKKRYETLETKAMLEIGKRSKNRSTLTIPCRLERKKNHVITKKQRRVSIKSITKIDYDLQGNCIQVDSKDGLYCIGKTMIPTHNSTIVSDFVLWLIGKDSETETNDIRIIYASFSDRLSKRANKHIQRFTNTQRFKSIFPNHKATKQTQEDISFGDSVGYFRNTTVNGAITGETMDVGILDDVLKGREEANSQLIRDKKWDWIVSDFMSRYSEYGGLIGIMTRWHVDDPFGRLIETDKSIKVLKYKAIAEVDEMHRKQGEPLFPELKSLKFLNNMKSKMTAAIWSSLYQQNPTIADGNFFKPDFMPTVDALPSGLQYVRAWDLAATESGGDYTTGVKFAYSRKDKIGFVVDVVRGQWSSDKVEQVLLSTAQADGIACKIRLPKDPGQAGKSQAKNLVKLLSGFSVITENVSGDKVTRASPVSAQVNVGNIYILRGAWNRSFTEELRLFPNGINDDQVDALSDAYNHFISRGDAAGESVEVDDDTYSPDSMANRRRLATQHG